MKIKLNFPITTPTGEVSELEMRRAKAKDLRLMNQHENLADQEFHLFASLTGLMLEDLEELDMSDYQKLQQAFKDMSSGKSLQ